MARKDSHVAAATAPTAPAFVIPAPVYEQAIKKSKSRNPKFFNEYLAQASAVLGVSVDTLRAAMDAETENRTKTEKQEGARGKLDGVVTALRGVKLPVDVRKLVGDLHEICETLDLHADIALSSEGINVNVAHSELSEKSRISPFLAYERGVKAGDTFKLEKLGTRAYRDEAGREFTNLTGWIRQNQPNSHTADVLRRYGQL